MPAATPVEPFHPTSGQAVGWTGLVLLCVGAVWAVVDDPGLSSARVALGMLLAATVVWATMLRPRALVRHDQGVLVLRNPLSDTHVPLSRIDRVSVRQTLDVQVDEDRYVCIGIGRTAREAMRRRKGPTGEMESLTGHPAPAAGEGYGDYVARRIGILAHEARSSAPGSSAPRASAGQGHTGDPAPPAVRREWAVPEIVTLTVLALAFLGALVVV
jgi:hypothetical protein